MFLGNGIHGFQINQKEANEFRIVTPEQYKSLPKLGSLYYGQETGTIEMVVFQESKQPLPKTTDPLHSVLMSERQGSSAQQPESRDEIKRQIAKELPPTRNLLASGDKLLFEVKSVTFIADPKPIMSTTIKYWKNN